MRPAYPSRKVTTPFIHTQKAGCGGDRQEVRTGFIIWIPVAWHTSSSKVLPPKGFISFQRVPPTGNPLCKHMSLRETVPIWTNIITNEYYIILSKWDDWGTFIIPLDWLCQTTEIDLSTAMSLILGLLVLYLFTGVVFSEKLKNLLQFLFCFLSILLFFW